MKNIDVPSYATKRIKEAKLGNSCASNAKQLASQWKKAVWLKNYKINDKLKNFSLHSNESTPSSKLQSVKTTDRFRSKSVIKAKEKLEIA